MNTRFAPTCGLARRLLYDDLGLGPPPRIPALDVAGEPLRPEADPDLFFYFAFHPAEGLGETTATAEILNNGRVLASAPVDLPDAAGADVRVQHVGKLPIADFPKGTFELRLVLRQAEQEQVRTAYFRVER